MAKQPEADSYASDTEAASAVLEHYCGYGGSDKSEVRAGGELSGSDTWRGV